MDLEAGVVEKKFGSNHAGSTTVISSTTGGGNPASNAPFSTGINSQSSDKRAPLRSIPTPPPHAAGITAAISSPTPVSASRVSSSADHAFLSKKGRAVHVPSTSTDSTAKFAPLVDSFELENTANLTLEHSKGGAASSFYFALRVLRLPWLRSNNKKRRTQRLQHRQHQGMGCQLDENSSIKTNLSRLSGKQAVHPTSRNLTNQRGGDNHQIKSDSEYFGGLMKTAVCPSEASTSEEGRQCYDINYPHQRSAEAEHSQSSACPYLSASSSIPQQGQMLHDQAPPPLNVFPHQLQTVQSQTKYATKQTKSRKKANGKSVLQMPAINPDQNLLPRRQEKHHCTNSSTKKAATPRDSRTPRHASTETPSSATTHLDPRNNNKVFRSRSWISASSQESNNRCHRGRRNGRWSLNEDNDSLADFDDAEWTPQDSAYGAAFPVCGWVPKRLRQGIEATLIALAVVALVYLVVTTSMNVQEGKPSGKHIVYNDSFVIAEFDDDWYVEYSQYQKDEDDYFRNSNNLGEENGEGRQNEANGGS